MLRKFMKNLRDAARNKFIVRLEERKRYIDAYKT